MTREIDENLVANAVDEVNLIEELELRRSYSGRGMYNHEMWGVVGSQKACSYFLAFLGVLVGKLGEIDSDADMGFDVMADLIGASAWDTMGHDAILYFPGIELI